MSPPVAAALEERVARTRGVPLVFLPCPSSCLPLVARLRAIELRHPCSRRVELLVLRMGSGFDVSAASGDESEGGSDAVFAPLNSPRWRSPMGEADAAMAFEDWASRGYPR
jgi:hypothetical protein